MVRFRPLDAWIDPRGGSIERINIDNGIIAIEVLSLGGIIRSLWTPDREGERSNIVLGCDSVSDYLTQQAHLGAIAGRYANRIAGAKLSHQGSDIILDNNHQDNCLHGGKEGFNRKQWHIGQLSDGVRLSLLSADGDMGFPGNCTVQLDYRLVANNLYVEILAVSDRACPISLTQHSYFNLQGSSGITNHNHLLSSPSRHYLQCNEQGIPTEIAKVDGTILDLRQGQTMAEIQQGLAHTATKGIDHCYLTGNTDSKELTYFGALSDATSGRKMSLYTNQPSVQIYGANFLHGTIGKHGDKLASYQGVCLEPQQLPDGPNQPHLPGKSWFEAGEVYHHISRYQFDTF
ncbi:aldose epimerase family protein [Shewanella colwelliana]|uniref:Aldose 1-epimerase n=1 Tax=Shewanella colwelliana TaxID=23 RepID=A0A1E5IVN4_SHECO|nr:aldose epimerase family protein [Shewanella colwelliana]MDX1282306.1 aldose epimerase family protein [Shewanella colwelliana]OEG74128.1 galactose mutarotase [Shewanella colwelliana]